MSVHLATLMPALGFTLGCVGIHALRERATQVSSALQCLACFLLVSLIAVGLSRTTGVELTDEMAFDMAGALAPLPSPVISTGSPVGARPERRAREPRG